MTVTPTDPQDFEALWDYDDPAGTETKFRALLPGTTPGSAYQVELLTQIARCQGLQQQFEAAHHTLDQAQAVLPDNAPRARIRLFLERGRVLNSSGRQPEASRQFREAWQLATAVGEDFYAVDAAHMLAISEPPSEQLAWNQHAIALAEQSTQPRARNWLGSLYNNLGWTLHDQGEAVQALDLFERALELRVQQGKDSDIRIARWCVARCWRSLGRVDEALSAQRALAAEHAAAGSEDGYVDEELGECLLLLGWSGEAQAHFARAHVLLSQDAWLLEAEPARLARLKQLAGDSRPLT